MTDKCILHGINNCTICLPNKELELNIPKLNIEFADPETEKLSALLNAEEIVQQELTDHLKEIYALEEKIRELRGNTRNIQVKKSYANNNVATQRRVILEAEKEKAKAVEANKETQFFKDCAKQIAEICKDFPSLVKAHPYQHQDIIATFAAYQQGKTGMLNANDMGLGKSMESAILLFIFKQQFIKEHGRNPNILWLTKKSLMKSSPIEIKRWWPDIKIVTPGVAKNVKERNTMLEFFSAIGDMFLCNYEFVRTTPKIHQMSWDFVVIDEVHKLKGGANIGGPTAIWESCKEICIKSRFNMMLSGTPMVNDPTEMWSYLHIFSPDRFPSVKKFRTDFMEYKQLANSGQYALQIDPRKILESALRGQMIRRSRDEVGLELPEITDEFLELEMLPEQEEAYNSMREQFFVWLDEQKTSSVTATAVIAQLIRLRQISVWPAGIKAEYVETDSTNSLIILDNEVLTYEKALAVKESAKLEETMERITNIGDSQIIIGCTFNAPLREIQRRCDELNITCEVISGESTIREKNRDLEKEFQQKEIQVLCLNTAMGEGLNLQKNPTQWPGGASYAILLDQWYNPSRQDQFIGRIHRQGSKIPVTVWRLHHADAVDAFIKAMCEDKAASFADIMSASTIRPASEWASYLKDKI